MSAAQRGKPHSWSSASTRPEVASKISEWWTPERREAKRLEMLQRNPDAKYHGLSARAAARLRAEAGACQRCGSRERLHIHHRDRDKRNQDPANLEVLCKPCHSAEHRGEKRDRRSRRPAAEIR